MKQTRKKPANKYLFPLVICFLIVAGLIAMIMYSQNNQYTSSNASTTTDVQLMTSPSTLSPASGCVLSSPDDVKNPSSYVCHLQLTTSSQTSIAWSAMRNGLSDAKLSFSSADIQANKPVDVELVVPQTHCSSSVPVIDNEEIIFLQSTASSIRTQATFKCK